MDFRKTQSIRIEQLEEQKMSLSDTCQRLHDDNTFITAQFDQLRAEVDSLEEKLEDEKTSYDSLHALLKASEAYLTKAQEEVDYLKSPEGRSAERLCASIKEIGKVAELEAKLSALQPVVDAASSVDGLNNFEIRTDNPDLIAVFQWLSNLSGAVKALKDKEPDNG